MIRGGTNDFHRPEKLLGTADGQQPSDDAA
jgi:hypothetical protein